jgi:hypothetical protein
MIKKHRVAIAWWLWLLMLVHASFFWGGIAITPAVGDWVVHDAVQQNARLTRLYLWLGEQVVKQAAPLGGPSYAETHAGQLYPDIPKHPDGSALRIVRDMGVPLQVSHFGMPVMFVLAVLLYWRRPKTIRIIG